MDLLAILSCRVALALALGMSLGVTGLSFSSLSCSKVSISLIDLFPLGCGLCLSPFLASLSVFSFDRSKEHKALGSVFYCCSWQCNGCLPFQNSWSEACHDRIIRQVWQTWSDIWVWWTESSTDVLPRLFKIKYDSGLLDELLYLDLAQE